MGAEGGSLLPTQGWKEAIGDGVRHLLQDRCVEIGDVVACLVVARVIGNACGATKDGRLSIRLDALGAGEQTTRGDAIGDETGVVRASVKLSGLRGPAVPNGLPSPS